MALFDDNPFVTVKPGKPAGDPPPLKPDEIVRGSYWSLYRREGGFVLQYMSGAVAGLTRETAVSEAEAEALKGGDDAIALKVLIAHGVG